MENDENDLFRALQKIDLMEKLGKVDNVWVHDGQGKFYQEVNDRNQEGKTYSTDEVDEMMDALDVDTIFLIPDNGRDGG